MPQFPQRLGLDLPNPLTSDLEALSHFFQRVFRTIFQPKTHLDHPFFTRRKRAQNLRGVLLQIHTDHRIRRRNRAAIFDEVAEVRILFLADRRFQRNRLLRNLQHLANLRHRNIHPLGDFFRGRLATEFLHKLPRGADQLVDGLDHVNWNADGPSLIGNGAGNRLPNPPRRIRRKFVTATVFELVHRLHQADVAFLNQIEELQSAVRVLLRNRNHQPQFRLNQLALGVLGVHIALDHFALRALQFRDRYAGFDLQFFKVGAAVLLLAAIFLLQFFALRLLVLLLQRANLPLQSPHDLDGLVDLVEQALAFHVGVLQLTHNAGDQHLLARNGPAGPAMFFGLGFDVDGGQLLFQLRGLLLVLHQNIDPADRLTNASLQNLFSELFLVEDHHFLHVPHAALQVFAQRNDLANHNRRARDGLHHAHLPALNALGNLNLALARQQRNRAHLAQVHAHGVVGLLQCSRSQVKLDVLAFLALAFKALRFGAFQQVDSLSADRRDQIIEVVGGMDVPGQKIIDLAVSEVTLLLACLDQFIEFFFVLVFNRQARISRVKIQT